MPDSVINLGFKGTGFAVDPTSFEDIVAAVAAEYVFGITYREWKIIAVKIRAFWIRWQSEFHVQQREKSDKTDVFCNAGRDAD